MAYHPLAVANYILRLAESERGEVTPLKLQKLLFFTHGYLLGKSGEPAVTRPFEVWQFGPVSPPVYFAYNNCGANPIKSLVFRDAFLVVPEIAATPERDAIKEMAASIWQTFGSWRSLKLSELTHIPGAPWSMAKEQGLSIIPDEMIREYYAKLWGTHNPHEPAAAG